MRSTDVINRARVIITTLAVIAAAPTAFAADKVDKFIFTSIDTETKKFTIVSMNADGSKRTTLTTGEDMEVDPALSPDGKRIVFISVKKDDQKSDVCVMNVDGTGRRTILKGEGDRFAMSPVWSPDGRRIAYTVPKDGVIVMDADGKNGKTLGGGILADWSPDGKQILYTAFAMGDSTIHVMDADGKNARKLVDGAAMPGAYSPDGKRLVYMGSPDGPRVRPCIFTADVDGANARQLTSEEKATDLFPRWSPDGRHIYFTRVTGLDRPPGRAVIHVMDADGKNVKELTRSTGMDMLGGQGITLWMAAPRKIEKPPAPKPPRE